MSAQCSHPACVTCGRPSRRPESSTQSADQCGGGRRRPETRSTAIRTRYSRSPAGQSIPSRARRCLLRAFADLVRVSGQQHTPGGHRVVDLEGDTFVEDRRGQLRARICSKDDVAIEDRVVHGQYGKLLGELHTDATERAPADQDVALVGFDLLESSAGHGLLLLRRAKAVMCAPRCS